MNRREFLQEFTEPLLTNPAETPPAPPLPAIQAVPTAGSPRRYAMGARILVEDARAWLCRDDGGFYAVDAHCPHLGCIVRPIEADYVCPGHQSRFNALGEREAGCTPRGLRFLYVDLDAQGQLIIDRQHTVDPRDRFMA